MGVEDDSKPFNLHTLKIDKGIKFEVPEVEDTFKLPYGVGFDHVIKVKTDLLN